MRGLSGPPRAPTKIGPSGGKRMRADRGVVGDQRQHVLQHRHHAGLVALAGHDDDVALAGQRHVALLQAQRLGDAQARTVEQRHHGGVARPDPGIAVLAGALVGIGKTFGGRHLDRLRQALADLRRADRRERADLALAFAFQKTSERAQARQRPHQRAAADVVGAAHRHEGPDVAGFQRGKSLQRDLSCPNVRRERSGIGGGRGHRPPASSATAAVRRADATASASSPAPASRRRNRVRSVEVTEQAWSWTMGALILLIISHLFRLPFANLPPRRRCHWPPPPRALNLRPLPALKA